MKTEPGSCFRFLFVALNVFAVSLPGRAGTVSAFTSPEISALTSGNALVLNPDQPTYDFDFGSPLFGPPAGNDQQTTLAVDSVGGNDANAGTLYAPKLTLPQTITNGSMIGLYRGSVFRDSLPLSTLGNTHGIVVQDLALGSIKPLPMVSAMDLAVNASFTSNGDGTYSYLWTPSDTLTNDGYSNVYAVEVNTATEAVTPIAARRRMVDVSAAAGAAGTAWIQAPGTGTGQSGSPTRWKAIIHPSDNLAPGSGTYRYEVVSRKAPADWGAPTNVGDGAMSGLQLVGGCNGYGVLGGPTGFVGDRLAFVHGTTHNAVIGGGSLQRSIFYESGDPTSIMLAWYAGAATGLRWDMRNCLFYANVGDRSANGLISHGGGGTTYDRGDISDTAFIGARWSDGSLNGLAMDYVNVAGGTINRVYVQAIQDILGLSMPASIEVKNSVFRQVNKARITGSFHDNIVLAESGSKTTDWNNRAPIGCFFQQSNASATNNILWSRGISSGVTNDDQASGIYWYNNSSTGCTCARNIIVLDPASTTAGANYLSFGSADKTGETIDYNLVISTAKAGCTANNPTPGPGNFFDWASYQSGQTLYDQHSLYVDLSNDPRGLKAAFVDPINGDFRWAQTDVGSQCAAYCLANNVGPATVTTHWPLVPTVDAAVAAISLLPPVITSRGAVSFTNGVYGEYQIATSQDGTPGAPTSYSVTGLPAWLSVQASSGVLSGTPPQTGNFGLTVSATNRAGTGSAALGITVQTAFMAWQNTSFTADELTKPAVSGPNAAPAGDGIPNLMKYALGLKPKSDGTGALPTISFTAAGGSSFLTLTYNRSLAASDVGYTVEVSGDLQTWSSGTGYTATVSTTNNAANTMQTVVQRDLTPTRNAGRRFIRLKITQP